MKKLTLLAFLCAATSSIPQAAQAQESITRRPASLSAASSEREQDGLIGPVRRVRVETAKIGVREGKPVEGARVVEGITTYDVEGRRIDTVAHPVGNSTVPGKEQYRYDDKGHIIEMVLVSENGSILGKEIYQYEFDELGNWKKMTTSVAVYEEGKLGFEPSEITYRTITYYYNQAFDKISKVSAAKPGSASPGTANQLAPLKEDSTASKSTARTGPEITGGSVPAVGGNHGINEPTNTVPSSGIKDKPAVKNSPARTAPVPVEERTAQPKSTRTEGLSAVSLIQADDANGGNKDLSNRPTPTATGASSAVKNNPAKTVPLPLAPVEAAIESSKPGSNRSATESVSRKSAPEDATSFYERGLSDLRAGRNAEAVETLKQAVYLNPEDARAYAKLGLAYSALRQHKEAIAVFKLANRIKPEVMDAEANFRLGEAYTAIGKPSDGLKALKQALFVKRAEALEGGQTNSQKFPTVADLHSSLGLAYYNAENYREAVKELKQAAALEPGSADVQYGLALAYIASGDRGSAQKQEKILRSLDVALADNISAALSGMLSPGVTRVAPREDRRMRP